MKRSAGQVNLSGRSAGEIIVPLAEKQTRFLNHGTLKLYVPRQLQKVHSLFTIYLKFIASLKPQNISIDRKTK